MIMKNKRIKVFLGGYVNALNAQNNNCRSLSEHLDQERFEIWTMLVWHPSATDFSKTKGVHYIYDTPSPWTEKLHLPYWLFAWMAYAIGIIKCDVAYLPKGEYVRFCRIVARLSGCKLFTTLEGIIDETLIKQINISLEKYVSSFNSYVPHLYSITRHMATREAKDKGLVFADKILYLGVDSQRFIYTEGKRESLKNIIFIGFSLVRKRAPEFIRMAQDFPSINFHIVGGIELENGVNVEDYIRDHHITNCKYHGPLNHSQLSDLLHEMDLMFFPSRSEGFPKVMLETACAGVPTLCYGDYGADEWITTSKNGFVVNTYEEACAVIQDLIDSPNKLQPLSDAAIELGRSFDWSVLVKTWKEEIEKIASEK